MTIAEYVDRWAILHPRRSWTTTSHNRAMVRPLVERHGAADVSTFSREQAVGLAESNPSSARYARALFSDVVSDGLRGDNPFAGLVPREGPGRSQIDALTVGEVERLCSIALELHGRPFWGLLRACAFTGLRGSEAAALEACDVDLALCPPVVAVRAGKGGEPRECMIPSQAVEALSGAPFRTATGRVWRRHSWGRAMAAVSEVFGRRVTLHETRHFCASWMVDNGAQPIDLALQLHGKTDPDTVLRYYVHVQRRASFERLAEVTG